MDKNNSSNFKLLMRKDIYAILDGDAQLGEYSFGDDSSITTISMPYLTGPKLCEISTHFGLPTNYYQSDERLSRWKYLENLFEHCVKAGRCSDLLAYLFDKSQFLEKLRGHNPSTIDAAYAHFIKTIIDGINGILCFGEHELSVTGNNFSINKIGASVELHAPQIKSVDSDYIKDISSRAMEDIKQGNYDSAITKSRTILEEVFCFVIERKNITPSKSGNIKELYKQVKDLYSMHGDKKTDIRINQLLSGLESILSAIAEMRNKDSDSHGVGSTRISIDEHHARLFVNSAIAMADFILSVENKASKKNTISNIARLQ